MTSPTLSGLAGLLASMASVVLLYPLDQAGVISQASGEHASLFSLFMEDLFRGLGSQLQATGFSYFVYFGVYTSLKTRFRRPQLPQSLADLLAASLAGMLGVMLSNPLWVATTRLKIGKATGAGLWEEIAYIIVEEGTGALWNGVSSSILLVANPAIQQHICTDGCLTPFVCATLCLLSIHKRHFPRHCILKRVYIRFAITVYSEQ
ncbi:unnamed protein product [Durusdinium trenchii]|uniref:Uncharacterized protein n=1 Tax=Durusdinium trenchii TaxID=1381693 RepID=A0ABP0R3F8_9DINO